MKPNTPLEKTEQGNSISNINDNNCFKDYHIKPLITFTISWLLQNK